MAITTESIKHAAMFGGRVRSFTEAKTSYSVATAFLCHSHLDAELAKGIVHLLTDNGWDVYIDWEDASMPSTPNKETAKKIQGKIESMKYFLFLATENSMSSRWCPWEIGYANGKKPIDNVLIIPTSERGRSHGNEYLELYRRLDQDKYGRVGVLTPGSFRQDTLSTLR